jgi:hypothetical protein
MVRIEIIYVENGPLLGETQAQQEAETVRDAGNSAGQ